MEIKTEKDAERFEKLLSECGYELYEEANKISDYLIKGMAEVDEELKNGIPLRKLDQFIRLSMYLMKIFIFDKSKYTEEQLSELRMVWGQMVVEAHPNTLMNKYNITQLYDKEMDEVTRIYLEKVDLCEYVFSNSELHRLQDYLVTPASLFCFDYQANDFLNIEEATKKVKNTLPSKEQSEIIISIITNFTNYVDEKEELDIIITDILKKLEV